MHSDPLALIAGRHCGKHLLKIVPNAIFTGQPAADAKDENVTLPDVKSESVVHDYADVIVKRCYDFLKLLRSLTPANNENLPVLTLTYHDENLFLLHKIKEHR